ncbi:hypothetical protein, partial [Endozoicomonas sp. ISHI1]|uniref:hypothetical protein n=1 Tax=Endozoicomonas sp. ISHI1 TaxID=2825882 RepID=UPI00214973DB
LCASISSARKLLILCIIHHLPLRVGCHANKLLVSPLKGLGRRCAAPHSMALAGSSMKVFSIFSVDESRTKIYASNQSGQFKF